MNSYATVRDSILFDDVSVGRGAKIRRAIIDKTVSIPAGWEVGYDSDVDRSNGFHVTDSGIVVISSGGSPRFPQAANGCAAFSPEF